MFAFEQIVMAVSIDERSRRRYRSFPNHSMGSDGIEAWEYLDGRRPPTGPLISP